MGINEDVRFEKRKTVWGLWVVMITHISNTHIHVGFPGGSVVKKPPANAEDLGSIPGSERSLGEGNGNPLQCSCLGIHNDKGTWRAIVLSVAVKHDLI